MQTTEVVVAIIVIMLAFCFALPVSLAQDYAISFQLLDEKTNTGYSLNIVVPETLYQYFKTKSHSGVFAKFVTPYALKPIADNLRRIYPDDEDFTNAALMIVHQLNYVETQRGKYPAETLVDDQGDCDIFSYVAASIIKAGGIDVVLLHYEEKKHMNIGVHLSTPPQDARRAVYKITFNDVDYYIAETTGGNWMYGWRVGECPDNVKNAKVKIIRIVEDEEITPEQISARVKKLENSRLNLEIWPLIALEESVVTFKGSLTPMKPNENVTIQIGISGSPWTVSETVQTNDEGNFQYVWKTNTSGIYVVRASWTGDDMNSGVSSLMTDVVVSVFVGALIVIAVIALIITAVTVVASRYRAKSHVPRESEPTSIGSSSLHFESQ